MKIEWTVTHEANFDLEQAIEDYNLLTKYQYDVDHDKAIYDAVEANIYGVGEYEEPIEIAANALRETLREGIQMRMEDLPSFPTLWWEDSVWKKQTSVYFSGRQVY